MKHIKNLLTSITLSILATSCGDNVFESLEKTNPAEEATLAMEQGKPDKAIIILNRALSGDANNYQLLSAIFGNCPEVWN